MRQIEGIHGRTRCKTLAKSCIDIKPNLLSFPVLIMQVLKSVMEDNVGSSSETVVIKQLPPSAQAPGTET